MRRAVAGQSACFALNRIKREDIRKGMVLLSPALSPLACGGFVAEVTFFQPPASLTVKTQVVVHVGNVYQSMTMAIQSVSLSAASLHSRTVLMHAHTYTYTPAYIHTYIHT